MVKLPDPQCCRHCGKRGRVVDTRMGEGYRWRRRACATCTVPSEKPGEAEKPHRWNTYETIIDPRRITTRVKNQPA